MRRAGFLGHHPPRDKEHHRASPKCRRESTPQTPLSVLQNFRSIVDDPVARAAPAPADIIIDRPDPPTSIVAQSLKWKRRRRSAATQPARAGRSARRRSVSQLARLESAAPRARARAVQLR
jgi:hypothetical protein